MEACLPSDGGLRPEIIRSRSLVILQVFLELGLRPDSKARLSFSFPSSASASAAARLVSGSKLHDHITPILREL